MAKSRTGESETDGPDLQHGSSNINFVCVCCHGEKMYRSRAM